MLGLAVGHSFWCGTTLVTMAQLDNLLSAHLPGGTGVALCCVRLFLCGCTLRRVMYECFFFLYDVVVLLPLFQKKKLGSGLVFAVVGLMWCGLIDKHTINWFGAVLVWILHSD